MRHAVRMPLRLVDGKFMRGDIEVKPEIGNPEQIALLQKIERERTQQEKDANDGRLDVDIHVEDIKVGSINSIFYFLHKAAEPFNCLEQDNLTQS